MFFKINNEGARAALEGSAASQINVEQVRLQ